MVDDVRRVNRGAGSPDAPKKKRTEEEAAAFREMMQQGKVRETDPEEQRKRKMQHEAEEETKADITSGGPLPGQVPIESVPEEDKFRITLGESAPTGGFGASAPSSYGSGETEESPPTSPPEEAAPTAAPASQAPTDYPQMTYYVPSMEDSTQLEPSAPTGSQPTQPTQPTQQAQPAKGKTGAAKKTHAPGPTPKVSAPKAAVKGEQVEKREPAAPKKEAHPKEEKLFPKLTAKEQEKQTAEQVEGLPPLPPGSWEAQTQMTKEDKSKKKSSEVGLSPTEGILGPSTAQILPMAQPLPIETTAPYLRLTPEMRKLFDTMVSGIMVVNTQGKTETTLTLDSPRFANSAFFGSEIVITEFASAPKIFNIELVGSQKAVDLMNKPAIDELLAAFKGGGYTFDVNRITAVYRPLSPDEKRKVQKPKGRT